MTIKFDKNVKLPKLLIKVDRKTETSSCFSFACKVYIIAMSNAFCVVGPKGLFGFKEILIGNFPSIKVASKAKEDFCCL